MSAKEGTGIHEMFKQITQELCEIEELTHTAATVVED